MADENTIAEAQTPAKSIEDIINEQTKILGQPNVHASTIINAFTETLKGTLDDVIGKVGELGKSVATNSTTELTFTTPPIETLGQNNFSG